MMELGIAREKGYPVDGIDQWASKMLTDQFHELGYCVYRIASYWIPVQYADLTWITTWLENQDAMILQGYTDADAIQGFINSIVDTQHGYAVIASAAAALNACYPGADIVWNFVKTNVRDANVSGFNENPKWAINPRGTIRTVGTGMTYATVQAAVDAANDWDVIQIYGGTYTQSAGWANVAKNHLTFIGMDSPRPVLDANGSCLSGKGIFNISGHDITVQNLEFANARNGNHDAAGICLQGRNIIVSGCYFHDCDNGLLGDATAAACNVSIDTSEFNHNGYGDGSSHNLSVGPVDSLQIKFCYVHNSNAGDEIKSKAKVNYVLYNRIGNEGGNGLYEAPTGQWGHQTTSSATRSSRAQPAATGR